MINKTASLSPAVLAIIEDKGTELPFTGSYDAFSGKGTYLCRRCGLALFRSESKFHSGCGWPSFDHEIAGAVLQQTDADGRRTEILCSRCQAHLGHVFYGENFTGYNTRHCVNSASLEFVAAENVVDTEEAILAAGCFWGVQYYLQRLAGVVKTEVGYCGGTISNPTYHAVCAGNSGHYEAIRVIYDPQQLTYEALIKYFFEIHDASQRNGQGPDVGLQYQSAIFYYDAMQKQIASEVIGCLLKKEITVATKLLPVQIFWQAEDYHQEYYARNHKQPYCHRYTKIF